MCATGQTLRCPSLHRYLNYYSVMLINIIQLYHDEDRKGHDYTFKMLIPSNYVTKLIGQSNYKLTQRATWSETLPRDQEEPKLKYYQIDSLNETQENASFPLMGLGKTKSMPLALFYSKSNALKTEGLFCKVVNLLMKTLRSNSKTHYPCTKAKSFLMSLLHRFNKCQKRQKNQKIWDWIQLK